MENNGGKENNLEEELEHDALNKNNPKKLRVKKIIINTDKVSSIINGLNYFLSELDSIENISSFLSQDNLQFFYSLSLRDNIKVNLVLSNIYYIILSKDFLYKKFLPLIQKEETYKIDIILELVRNISFNLSKLDKFIFSYQLFDLKKKSLGLLNILYNNCKNRIKIDDSILEQIVDLMDSVTKKFYSNVFNEICQSQDIFEILKFRSVYMINKFEEKLSQINNYFEQYEVFKKFIEINTDQNLKCEVSKDNLTEELFEFYEKFGVLLLKFCSYHNYIFLEKKEEENLNEQEEQNKNGDNIINKEENDENIKLIFLIDKMRIDENKNKNYNENNNDEYFNDLDKKEKVQKFLINKRYKSSLSTKQYYEIISKGIKFYLNHVIKNIKMHPKLKPINDNLNYFLDSFEIESYYPLYLNNISKIVINDNFTKAYVTNVFPGEENTFYFDIFFKDESLIYFEYFLEDKSMDINFELKIYDNYANEFISVYKGERVSETFRFFINSNGYCIYKIIFDNKFSWFNNKVINFRFSYLNPITEQITDEMLDNENYFIVNKEYYFYIPRKISIDSKLKNIPIVVNLNNLRTVTLNDKNEILFKENKEDGIIISKVFFNYILSDYLQKLKIKETKKLLISIISQNEDLTNKLKDLKEQLDDCIDIEDKKFIKYLGFCPDKKIYNFNIKYKIYDLNEQLVICHKLLKHNEENNKNKNKIKSLLLIHVNKNLFTTIFFYKGKFYREFTFPNKVEISFENININKEKEIFDLIKEVNKNMSDIEVILRKKDDLDKKEIDLIERIKKYCQEEISPSIPFYEYDTIDLSKKIINYIYSLNGNNLIA